MPWLWASTSNTSIVIIDIVGGANRTMPELPCDGVQYAFLACVVATVTMALFLRVSWLPKLLLLLVLAVSFITVLELSGYRRTVTGSEFIPLFVCVCVIVFVKTSVLSLFNSLSRIRLK